MNESGRTGPGLQAKNGEPQAVAPVLPARPDSPDKENPYKTAHYVAAHSRRGPDFSLASMGGEGDPTAEAAAVLLVRGAGAERQVAVPRVSLGAQTIFYVSMGQQSGRGAQTSF